MCHLNGYINSQNSRMWSAENSQALHENSLHSSNVVFVRTVSKTNSGAIVI